jgi:HEPN domain-containing protein
MKGMRKMTPKELREKAREQVDSARVLFQAGQFDIASYNVGYAAEFALKARYCTRNGLGDFPTDKASMKQLGVLKLKTHDLDDLLKLSEDIRILPSAMRGIDWDRVTDWSPEQRYSPIGNKTPTDVEQQIRETEALRNQLDLFEITRRLLSVTRGDVHGVGSFLPICSNR